MNRKVIMTAVSVAAWACMGASDKAKIAQVVAGERTEARASWWGFDPEDATRFLQAAIDSRVPRLIVDNMGSAWVTDRLRCVSDQEIFFEQGVEVLAKAGAFTGSADSLFTLKCVTNVTLRGPGATLHMRRADYDAPPYVKAEWRHVLNICSSAKINIFGLTLAESGGDGIYLGAVKPTLPNMDIHIKDVICDKNYRQGISVISAENLLIENTIMRNTAGTPPAAGIDFEPNHAGERLKNCMMRNCLTENNQGDGYLFALPFMTRASVPVSIRIENCRSVGDQIATRVITGNLKAEAVLGNLTFIRCCFETSRQQAISVERKPADGMSLDFEDCVLKNSVVDNPQTADILLSARTIDQHPVGGIQFERLHIQRPAERPWISWRDQSFCSEPVTEISGSVLIEVGIKKETLTLDPAWAARTFPARFPVKVPRIQADVTAAKVIDATNGLCALSPVKLRNNGTYLLFVKTGQEVFMTGQLTQIGRSPLAAIPLTIKSPSGKIVAKATPTNVNQRVEFRFTATEEGFYTLKVDMGTHAFALLSANVPVAVDATQGPAALIQCTGPLFVAVPHGTKLFAIGVSGEGSGEAVKVVIVNPDGKEVWQKDPVIMMERFTAQNGQVQAGGLWQIHFSRPSVGVLEDFRVEALGVPGYLFLHPARYWSF